MAEEQQFKRNIAYKLRIGDILGARPVLSNERFSFLDLNGKKVIRVNIVGSIVDKYENEGEKKYSFLTLDDGSGQIKLKAFGDDAEKLKSAVEKTSGGTIEGSKKFSDVVYKLGIAKLSALPSSARAFAFVMIGLSLFGAIKGIAFFAVWIVVGLMFLLFELLRVTNFFHIESENRNQEIVIVE